jgi:beta-barrel assembly-enhancing protease
VTRLRAGPVKDPMIDALAARVLQAAGEKAAAIDLIKDAMVRNPYYRPLVYSYAAALLEADRAPEAQRFVSDQLRLYPQNPELLRVQAKTYAALGKRLLQHQVLAEIYLLQGSLPAAAEQLQLAQSAGDGDFYELSAVEARLREVRARIQAESKQPK